MGLDQYILKTRKISREEAMLCNGIKADDIDRDRFGYIPAEVLEGNLRQIALQDEVLRSSDAICHKVNCSIGHFDEGEMRRAKGVPPWRRPTFTAYGNGGITLSYRDPYTGNSQDVFLTEEEYNKFVHYKEEPVYVFRVMEEFYYWRKWWNMHGVIEQALNLTADNCSYNVLNQSALDAIAAQDEGFREKLKTLDPDDVLIYHPWW